MSNETATAQKQAARALLELEQQATREYIHLADTLAQLAERLGFNATRAQAQGQAPLAMAAKWLALKIGRETQQASLEQQAQEESQAQAPLMRHRLRLYDLQDFDPIFSFTAPPPLEMRELTPLLRHVANVGELPSDGAESQDGYTLQAFKAVGFYRTELERALGLTLWAEGAGNNAITASETGAQAETEAQAQHHPERLADFIRMLIDCNPSIDLHSENGSYTGRQVKTRLEKIITTGYTQKYSKIPSQNTISSYLTA